MKSTTVIIILAIVVICFFVTACLFGLAFVFLGNQTGGFDLGLPVQTGRLAPDFQLETINGHQITLSHLRGQPVLLNFWATWCPPCREEMPLIQEHFQQYHPDLMVLAVEEGASRAELMEFVAESGYTFEVLMGNDEVFQRYAVNAIPTSIFIDAEGVIRSIVVGRMSESEIDAELAKIGVGD